MRAVSYEWARIQTNADVAITDAARLIDLIVVGRHGMGDETRNGDLAARLAELTTAPILLVPAGHTSLDLGGKVLVAWDGSMPNDAAVRAAVPLLKLASEVDVLTIGDTADDADPAEVADYLARHGCKVTARRVPKSGDIADQLINALQMSGAAWAVRRQLRPQPPARNPVRRRQQDTARQGAGPTARRALSGGGAPPAWQRAASLYIGRGHQQGFRRMTTHRTTDTDLHQIFLDRWSPRAFDGSEMPEADLATIFEAARWAPSSMNYQPWRFLYARRGDANWERFLSFLMPFQPRLGAGRVRARLHPLGDGDGASGRAIATVSMPAPPGR